jgi:hypothetical protein
MNTNIAIDDNIRIEFINVYLRFQGFSGKIQ